MNSAQASTYTMFLLKAEQSQREVTVTAYLFTCIFFGGKEENGKGIVKIIAKNDTHKRSKRVTKLTLKGLEVGFRERL